MSRARTGEFRLIASAALTTVLFVIGVLSAQALAAPPEKARRWAEGRILVQPRGGIPEHALDNILQARGGRSVGRIGRIDVHIVEVPPQAEDAVARALARNPHIQFAEKDMLVELIETTPDDPHYPSAWHLPKIQAPLAWDNALGNGITVAVLDTGVNANHEDLEYKLVPGWNAASQNNDTTDIYGHGTSVAGTVAAESNNALGVASVAWDTAIMPVRVTDRSDGAAYFSHIALGLTWAADNGAHVANISYDSLTTSSSIANAAQYMRNEGGVVVVAAGNSGSDRGYSDSPYMISVSATTSSDTRPGWSSFGNHVNVAAPGAGIWTTVGGSYGSVSGTSFSSPITAGVVALIMSTNPALSPDDVEGVLISSVDDLGDPDWDPYYGYGRVNAANAVQLAIGTLPGDNEAPTVAIDAPTGGSVSGLVAVEVSAQDNVGVTEVRLHADTALVGTDFTAPYQFDWDTESEANGNFTLVAHAYDSAGNEGSSLNTDVSVNNPVNDPPDSTAPQVNILSPTDGSTVSGTVTLSASASDNVAISMLTISVDGQTRCASNLSPLSCDWDTSGASAGAHSISATAQDTSGNTGSASITVNTPPASVYLSDDFADGDFAGWTVVDEGTVSAPSVWSAANGTLAQNTNIYSSPTSAADLPKLGTYLLYQGGNAWTDYRTALTIRSSDDDAIGVMFRVQDSANYYRFSWDKSRGYRRLVKRASGAFTLLAEDNVPYVKNQTYQVEITAQGAILEVRIDGTPIFSVTDASLNAGTIAMYSWGNQGSFFDDVLVEDLSSTPNQPPVITSLTATPATLLDNEFSQLSAVVNDPDGGPAPLSYSWTVPAGAGSVNDPSSPNPVYTPPTVSASQMFTLTVAVSDGRDTISQPIDVTVNHAGGSSTLLSDDFADGDFAGWTVVDEGTVSAPSGWSAANGTLAQNTNIYSNPTSVADLPKLGTYLLYQGGNAWTDYRIALTIRSSDDDAIGVMFRTQNSANYYRFSWDKSRRYRRLVKRVNGTFTLLAEDNVPYVKNQTYQVEITAQGAILEVRIDGTLTFSVTDGSLNAGAIAMYSWGNQGSFFDDVLVEDQNGAN